MFIGGEIKVAFLLKMTCKLTQFQTLNRPLCETRPGNLKIYMEKFRSKKRQLK